MIVYDSKRSLSDRTTEIKMHVYSPLQGLRKRAWNQPPITQNQMLHNTT